MWLLVIITCPSLGCCSVLSVLSMKRTRSVHEPHCDSAPLTRFSRWKERFPPSNPTSLRGSLCCQVPRLPRVALKPWHISGLLFSHHICIFSLKHFLFMRRCKAVLVHKGVWGESNGSGREAWSFFGACFLLHHWVVTISQGHCDAGLTHAHMLQKCKFLWNPAFCSSGNKNTEK